MEQERLKKAIDIIIEAWEIDNYNFFPAAIIHEETCKMIKEEGEEDLRIIFEHINEAKDCLPKDIFLADYYNHHKNYEEALPFLEKCIKAEEIMLGRGGHERITDEILEALHPVFTKRSKHFNKGEPDQLHQSLKFMFLCHMEMKAECYQHLDKPDLAVEAFEKIQEEFPEEAINIYPNYAVSLFSSGRNDEAENIIEKINLDDLKDKKQSMLFLYIGMHKLRKGDILGSLEMLQIIEDLSKSTTGMDVFLIHGCYHFAEAMKAFAYDLDHQKSLKILDKSIHWLKSSRDSFLLVALKMKELISLNTKFDALFECDSINKLADDSYKLSLECDEFWQKFQKDIPSQRTNLGWKNEFLFDPIEKYRFKLIAAGALYKAMCFLEETKEQLKDFMEKFITDFKKLQSTPYDKHALIQLNKIFKIGNILVKFNRKEGVPVAYVKLIMKILSSDNDIDLEKELIALEIQDDPISAEDEEHLDEIGLHLDYSARTFEVMKSGKVTHGGELGFTQEFLILEEAINQKGSIHWTAGFIIFKGWQKKCPQSPIEQFRRNQSPLNNEIFKIDVLIPAEIKSKHKDRSWELNKEIKLSSTIEDANRIIKELAKEKEPSVIIDKIEKAFSKHPDSIAVSKFVVEFLNKINDEKILNADTKQLIFKANDLLLHRKINLEAGLNMIQSEGKKNEWEGDWKEAHKYFLLYSDELYDIRKHHILAETLIDGKQIKNGEENFRTLMGYINDIKSNKNSENIYEQIKSNKAIQDCLKYACQRLKIWISTKDMEYYENLISDAESNLYSILKEKQFSVKTIKDFKAYTSATLFYELRKMYLDVVYGIPANEQNSLWELIRIRNQLAEQNAKHPTNDELLAALQSQKSQWDSGKLSEALFCEDKIKCHIDIENFDDFEGDKEFLAIQDRPEKKKE